MTMPHTVLPAIDHFNHTAIRPLDIASPSLRQLLIPTVESVWYRLILEKPAPTLRQS
jgi:hypothetical protein